MKKVLWWFCFIGFLLIFVVSSGIFLKKVLDKKQEADVNMNVREAFWSVTESSQNDTPPVTADTGNGEHPVATYTPPAGLVALVGENSNVVGWIKIDGTDVDYPIVYNKDDYDYYLKRDINGNRSATGSIFLDPVDDMKEDGLHILYGHHMRAGFKAGTMFRDVSKFNDPSYMAEHQTITVYTMDRVFHLKPVYCYNAKPDISYRETVLYRNDMHKFLKDKTKLDITSDNAFVLLTCDYTQKNARTYLICEEIS